MPETEVPQYCLVWGDMTTGFASHGDPSPDRENLLAWAEQMRKEFPTLLHDVIRDFGVEEWVASFPNHYPERADQP